MPYSQLPENECINLQSLWAVRFFYGKANELPAINNNDIVINHFYCSFNCSNRMRKRERDWKRLEGQQLTVTQHPLDFWDYNAILLCSLWKRFPKFLFFINIFLFSLCCFFFCTFLTYYLSLASLFFCFQYLYGFYYFGLLHCFYSLNHLLNTNYILYIKNIQGREGKM